MAEGSNLGVRREVARADETENPSAAGDYGDGRRRRRAGIAGGHAAGGKRAARHDPLWVAQAVRGACRIDRCRRQALGVRLLPGAVS